ncbi:siderophore ABC transporter substrate-binding protein [Comamonas sp. 23]|uniref:siderophore ABC transporter substrate-binding protein n=1 Tax=Comamonas sp. 23 TaxID=3415008 RepID=UPI003C6FE2DA
MTQPLTTACWRASAGAALATSLFAAPAAFAQAPAPKAPATITVQHAKGSTVVPLAPKRVVVYDLASLDTMQALNLPVTALAKANFPSYMQAYADARYLPAGTLFEPDFDALSHIRPDLIVVAGRSAGKYEILSKIAPTLDLSVNNQQLLADMQRNVTTLASLWGKEAQGEQLMQRVRAEVDSTRALAQQQAPGLLVLAISTMLNAQPPGARFGLLHDVLSVQPALPADASKPRGVPMKLEEIRQLNPAWLYVIDRNAGTGSTTGRDGKPVVASTELFNNDAIRNSAAGQQGRVVFLDPQVWYLLGVAGPQAMLHTTAQLKAVWSAR